MPQILILDGSRLHFSGWLRREKIREITEHKYIITAAAQRKSKR